MQAATVLIPSPSVPIKIALAMDGNVVFDVGQEGLAGLIALGLEGWAKEDAVEGAVSADRLLMRHGMLP